MQVDTLVARINEYANLLGSRERADDEPIRSPAEKLYLAAFGFMLLPGMIFRMLTGSDTNLTLTELQKPENQGLLIMQLAVGISSAIAAGGIANWLLFRRAQAAVRLSAMQEMPESETIPWLTRVGDINRLGVALAVMVFLVTSYAAVRA